ncbi:hypothetical protein VA596_04345 [Amycolatopsis sp., V23-08]|uniref:Secreted protein n=1 Tax=Amycolatopsis heterodermiae TaxID=3110235 RepID=A0ABU5QXT8_9PSEU|nr:hypothetical protein [Amycolatopsis sp., V23-08]MEA5358755.1 hypothetical protein [Amycolatopsis sp., V23-08]
MPAVVGAALIAAVAAITAAVINSSASKPSSSAPSPTGPTTSSPSGPDTTVCNGDPVDLSYGGDNLGPTAYAVFTIKCAPAAGREYAYVVEAENVGTNKHQEWYAKYLLPTQPGQVAKYTVDLSKDKLGDTNCLYAVNVTPVGWQSIRSSLEPGGFLLYPLPDAPLVSQKKCGARKY